MKTLIPITITLLLSFGALAQQNNSILDKVQQSEPNKGKVTINQSQHIAQLLNNRFWQNAQKPGMQGYRIRIFSELGQTARQRSSDAMSSFMEKYPNVKVYQTYENPYWKISIGNFRDKESAQKFYKMLLKDYPKAFLVPDWINFPSFD